MSEDLKPQAHEVPIEGEVWYPPAQDDAQAPEEHGSPGVFVGAEGLRAGWSLLIFFALSLGLSRGATLLMRLLHMHAGFAMENGVRVVTWQRTLLSDAIPFALLCLTVWIMSRIEGRRVGVYGLGYLREGRLRQFGLGLVLGVAQLALLVGALRAFHLLVFGRVLLNGGAAVRYGLTWALGFLFVGLTEEYLLRGYLQYTLSRGLAGIARALKLSSPKPVGFWVSALVFCFVFGFGHKGNPGESPVGLWAAGLVGLVFCFSLWRTGSLWWAVGWHAAWDWAQSYLFGVADSGWLMKGRLLETHPQGNVLWSGGGTGPEGSLLVLPTIAIAGLLVLVVLPKQGWPEQPERDQ